MKNPYEDSLFCMHPKIYEKIDTQTKYFAINYCGDNIIRDSIFQIAINYARKRELLLEVLRYPFKDDELWAFTFIKKGSLFLCINSELSLCKQYFAVAHELYHIHCYAEDIDSSAITCGSLLDSKTVNEQAMSSEDLAANAFAGLLLMPDKKIDEQIKLYGIDCTNISIDDVLILMDLFAMPYKAVVLRLVENHNISLTKAKELFEIDSSYINERISISGKALGWQSNSKQFIHFGSLLDNLEYNYNHDYLIVDREQADRQKLERIRNSFSIES